MIALFTWLFLAIALVLAAGIFLLPSISRRTAKKSKFTPSAHLFGEEYAGELPPELKPEPQARPVQPHRPPEAELPRSYGVDRLALMARDPHWIYA
jgi:hypothetical protein